MDANKNQLSTSQFLQIAEQRLPMLTELLVRQDDPYRINWVGGLLSVSIKRMEMELKKNNFSQGQTQQATNTLEGYRSALLSFKKNNQY